MYFLGSYDIYAWKFAERGFLWKNIWISNLNLHF
jgi:hypothetical protein